MRGGPVVGSKIRIVLRATEAMGKYAGTLWPMDGTFTLVEPGEKLVWDAQFWTEGDRETSNIAHVNELTMTTDGTKTIVRLHITITATSSAKMAVMGMKIGYAAQLKKLKAHLEG